MPINVHGGADMDLCVDRKWSWPHVFVRCIQNMLGVIIFIRIIWITDQVGLGMTIFFIFLGFLVSFLTTMSVAAISTDQRVGFFSTISTYASSAVAAGVAVLYVCSNVIAFAAFIVALAETLVNFLRNSGSTIIDGSINDMRIFSAVFCILVLLVATFRSKDYFKCRVIMMLLVLIAVLVQIVVLTMPSLTIERRVNSTAFKISDYNPYDEKAMGFVVYFPAVTCIFAGLTIPSSFVRKKDNIFHGTSLALVLSSLLYILTAVLEAHFFAVSHLVLSHIIEPGQKLHAMALLRSLPVTIVVLLSCFYCAYTAFISASQTVQAVGKSNGLVPGWDKLGRGYGGENSPRIAFIVITVVGIALTMIGDFNIIASIMTIYYLATFCILNYSVFMATLKSEKPMYRWFNRWLALICSLLCVHIMLAVSWKLTNAAILTFLKFYIYIKWKQSQPKGVQKLVGSSFINTLSGLQNMARETDLCYKPQMLLLTGNPAARPALVDFANNIIMGRSLLICGFVIPQPVSSRTYLMTDKVDRQMAEWFANRQISAFPATVANENQVEGAATLLQTSGIGKMRPNILMVGFKSKWYTEGVANLEAIMGFYEVILNAFEKNVGVAIFRNSQIGFDLTEHLIRNDSTNSIIDADENGINTDPYAQGNISQCSRQSSQKAPKGVSGVIRTVTSFVRRNAVADLENETNGGAAKGNNRFQLVSKHSVRDFHSTELMVQLDRFRTRIHHGTIDVWWLKDDGGLTLLLPYLLQLPGTYLEGARMRVFLEGGRSDRVGEEQKHMAKLLRAFRVDCSDLNVITGFDHPPNKSTMQEFQQLVAPFKNGGIEKRGLITDEELENFCLKTNRYLRTRELLHQHSRNADLIIVTLPIPRRSAMSASLYMSWLEMISKDLPPTLLIRGNRTSVLSYFE
ncbi:hypothetical protein V3C99_001928 [Haemonchus contortus]